MPSSSFLNHKRFIPESNSAKQKQPLIILHGLLGSMDNWRSQAKGLSQLQPVITVDLRNHGNSPHLQGMSYREMYDDVVSLAQHLSIESFDLLGHSMGGKVAMQLALSRSELINRLIVVDIAPKPYPLWHQETLHAMLTAPIETFRSRSDADNYLKQTISDQTERNFIIKNLQRNEEGSFDWKVNLKEISRGYLKIAGFTTAEQQFNKDTLFIKGQNSTYIQDSDAPIISQLFPNSTQIAIENSGHMPHFEQAELFFNTVNAFLSPNKAQ